MMNKYLTHAILSLLLIVTFSTFAYTQGESGVTFADGISVTHFVDYGTLPAGEIYSVGTTSSKNDYLYHQAFVNEATKTYSGYDLKVIPQDDPKKFKLLFKPLSIKPNVRVVKEQNFTYIPLPEYLGEIMIDDGDIVTLNIFENPQTKEKVTDLILVTRSKKVGPRFASKYVPKDFTLDDVQLSLKGFNIEIDGKSVHKNGGGASGGNVAVYLPGKGRFIMSPFQRQGYAFQKIGVITNNELEFSYAGENYKITSKEPILGNGGKWHCWILFEPNYVPKVDTKDPIDVITQAGTIEGLFQL